MLPRVPLRHAHLRFFLTWLLAPCLLSDKESLWCTQA